MAAGEETKTTLILTPCEYACRSHNNNPAWAGAKTTLDALFSAISGNVSHDKLQQCQYWAHGALCLLHVYQGFKVWNKTTQRLKLGALTSMVRLCSETSFTAEPRDCESKCFLWHVTKVVFQCTLRLLLYVYTRCYFPVIFNLLQDSSHWTVFLCFPLLFLVM